MTRLFRFLNVFSVICFLFFFVIFMKCARADIVYDDDTVAAPAPMFYHTMQVIEEVDEDETDPVEVREQERKNQRAILDAEEDEA